MNATESSSRRTGNRRGTDKNTAGSESVSGASQSDASAAANNGASETPQVPTPAAPKPTVFQFFMTSVAEIYAGRVTPPDEIYGGCENFDRREDFKVGVIEDQKVRELFSLHSQLEEMRHHLPRPRNASQVKKYTSDVKEYSEVVELAHRLAWTAVQAMFPGQNSKHWSLKDGWIIARPKTPKDQLREDLTRRGYSAEQIEAELAQMPGDDEDEGNPLDALRRASRGGRGPGSLGSLLEMLGGGLPGL